MSWSSFENFREFLIDNRIPRLSGNVEDPLGSHLSQLEDFVCICKKIQRLKDFC